MMDYNNTPFKNRDIDRLTKKTTKTPDSFMENAIEIVDPTGISSWDDVYRSVKKNGLMSGETALEVFGAIPLIGKVGKAGKIAKAAVASALVAVAVAAAVQHHVQLDWTVEPQ